MTALWTEPDRSQQSQAAGILEQESGNQVLPLARALFTADLRLLSHPQPPRVHTGLCDPSCTAKTIEMLLGWRPQSQVTDGRPLQLCLSLGSSSLSHLSHCLDANPWTMRSIGGEMGCRKYFILQWDWRSWQSLTQQCSKILVKCDYAFKEQIPSVHLNWAFPLLSALPFPRPHSIGNPLIPFVQWVHHSCYVLRGRGLKWSQTDFIFWPLSLSSPVKAPLLFWKSYLLWTWSVSADLEVKSIVNMQTWFCLSWQGSPNTRPSPIWLVAQRNTSLLQNWKQHKEGKGREYTFRIYSYLTSSLTALSSFHSLTGKLW